MFNHDYRRCDCPDCAKQRFMNLKILPGLAAYMPPKGPASVEELKDALLYVITGEGGDIYPPRNILRSPQRGWTDYDKGVLASLRIKP